MEECLQVVTNSRLPLRLDIYYLEHSEVHEQMGFMPDSWVEKTGKQRLDSYGDEIAKIEESIA